MKRTAYCVNCRGKRDYHIVSERVSLTVRGIDFDYSEKKAVCSECGNEVYVPEINDKNADARENAFRRAANLISVSEIKDIMATYSIGAGPLAKVLGLGEVTVNRYLLGQLPSREVSDKLYLVRSDRTLMERLLDENRDALTKSAYNKCREKLTYLNSLFEASRINTVTRYLLSRSGEVTPLALQKLLYYSQAFYHAIYRKDLFTDDCQAWEKGPVYPDIYRKFKGFGYDPIDAPVTILEDGFDGLSDEDRAFLDAVLSSFGIFSGTKLSDFTHLESPWNDARGSLEPTERSTDVIAREAINSYFDSVVAEYGILSPRDIRKYTEAMLKKCV